MNRPVPQAPEAGGPHAAAGPSCAGAGAAPGAAPPGADAGGPTLRERLHSHSELGVSVLLLVVGVLVLSDTLSMHTPASQRGPVGPKTVPVVVGVALLVVAVVLAVDVLRGGRGEAAAGEDVDTSEPAQWRTVALLAGVFLANAALIRPLGFPISGALLFWGSAYALGSRNLTRDPLIAAVLSLVTYAAFNTLLGVPLPGGPLMGVL